MVCQSSVELKHCQNQDHLADKRCSRRSLSHLSTPLPDLIDTASFARATYLFFVRPEQLKLRVRGRRSGFQGHSKAPRFLGVQPDGKFCHLSEHFWYLRNSTNVATYDAQPIPLTTRGIGSGYSATQESHLAQSLHMFCTQVSWTGPQSWVAFKKSRFGGSSLEERADVGD